MMKVLPVERRINALTSVGLILLSFCRPCPGPVAGAKLTQLDGVNTEDGQKVEPRTCADGTKDLMLTGKSESISFKCPVGSNLYPVEQASAGGRAADLDPNALNKVYVLTPEAREAQQCGPSLGELKALVPGSTLEEVKTGPTKDLGQDAGSQKVFKLTLGAAQPKETHFCYTCTVVHAGRASETKKCSIFVTVPQVPNPVQPPNGQTGDQTDKPTDQQTESGSSSQSVFSWFILSAARVLICCAPAKLRGSVADRMANKKEAPPRTQLSLRVVQPEEKGDVTANAFDVKGRKR
ncbi:hypothetical protein CSUI_004312 [Cystoisospora suis]|uniref:SRS domain-containing protein n=1 Tax=Cystoisospora suis TaxID=483139 RepID=A0A2C6L1E2_9APIC|nr:hypothetical protein CSUI_004312 [Cystoisospora suis]